jgi:hypothetical protein
MLIASEEDRGFYRQSCAGPQKKIPMLLDNFGGRVITMSRVWRRILLRSEHDPHTMARGSMQEASSHPQHSILLICIVLWIVDLTGSHASSDELGLQQGYDAGVEMLLPTANCGVATPPRQGHKFHLQISLFQNPGNMSRNLSYSKARQ